VPDAQAVMKQAPNVAQQPSPILTMMVLHSSNLMNRKGTKQTVSPKSGAMQQLHDESQLLT
jgi:hypothetical protein